MRILVVGGAVRDMLLGRPESDRDYLVLDAGPEEFLAAYPRARLVGKTFPVAWLDECEYAFGADVHADLLRRDLTVNALALGPGGILYAHPQAIQDLRDRVLRPASLSALEDDPVRVFRAARFYACLPGFEPHPDLLEAMARVSASGTLAGQLAERIGAETRKALACRLPGRFLALLRDTGSLSPWLAELGQAREVPAGPAPYHYSDVLNHTMDVMDRLAGDPLRVWMGLCHDLGKVATDPSLWPRHHGHDAQGAGIAKQIGERLRLPGKYIEAGAVAAREHMVGARYPELRPGTRVDLLARLHAKGLVHELFALVRADHEFDHLDAALTDLEIILAVRLPEKDRNLGRLSADRLRQLRCEALSR